jgi:hypothetical protein
MRELEQEDQKRFLNFEELLKQNLSPEHNLLLDSFGIQH